MRIDQWQERLGQADSLSHSNYKEFWDNGQHCCGPIKELFKILFW